MSILQFGAGNIGRGLIYPWIKKQTNDVVLIDNNKELVEKLKFNNKYTVFNTNHKKEIITDINIIHTEDNCISELINNSNIIITSVGVNNLKRIANTIINNFTWGNDITFICFENSLDAVKVLKTSMLDQAEDNIELIYNIQNKCTFINGVIDCIVPNTDLDLDILIESYSEWYIDLPNNINIDLFKTNNIKTDNFEYYINRKLYLFNIAHWALAYYGLSKGLKYIHEAWNDEEIFEKVADIIYHSWQFLMKKYPNRSVDMTYYIKLIISRVSNKNINDTLERVARDPLRKYNFIKELAIIYNDSDVFKHLLKEIEKKIYK